MFINNARRVHGDVYDYSDVVYTGVTHAVTVTCRKHGPFRVTPNAHINYGIGCPECLKAPDEAMVGITQLDLDEILEEANYEVSEEVLDTPVEGHTEETPGQ